MIHNTLSERAGNVLLPYNGLILGHTLRNNLLPDDGDKSACVQKEYAEVTYGTVLCCVPVGYYEAKKNTSPDCKSVSRLLTGGLPSLAVDDAFFSDLNIS